MNSTCSDCSCPIPRELSPYCNFCKSVRDEHSRPCSACDKGIIGPEEEDFIEVCSTCTIPKYKCSTVGCEAPLKEHWKKTCDKCFREQRMYGTPIKTNGSGSEVTKTCLTCPAVVLQQWQKYCMNCFKIESRSEVTGAYKCTTSGCNSTFPESWKKKCLACYKASKQC